jgi:hypothetical protein
MVDLSEYTLTTRDVAKLIRADIKATVRYADSDPSDPDHIVNYQRLGPSGKRRTRWFKPEDVDNWLSR